MTAQYDYDVRERQSGVNNYARVVADLEGSGGELKAYIQDEWQIHAKLALNFGGRYLFQDYRAAGIRSYELGPRAALAVRPNREASVTRGVGVLSPTHPFDEYPCRGRRSDCRAR